MSNKLTLYIVFLLLALALVLTYKITNKPSSSSSSSPTLSISPPKNVFQFPKPNASDKEKKAYADLVAKNAKDSTTLDISNCGKPNPEVIHIKTTSPINVLNNDSLDHTLVFTPSNTYIFKKSQTTSFSPTFPDSTGIYAYACDKINHEVGIIYITP